MSTKKVNIYGQADENGVIRVAFVGTEEELQAQIDKDYEDTVAKIKETYAKYEEDFNKVKDVDLNHLNAENIEDAAKYVWNKKMMLKTMHDLENFKKPTVQDGTYFLLDYVGKVPVLEEREK